MITKIENGKRMSLANFIIDYEYVQAKNVEHNNIDVCISDFLKEIDFELVTESTNENGALTQIYTSKDNPKISIIEVGGLFEEGDSSLSVCTKSDNGLWNEDFRLWKMGTKSGSENAFLIDTDTIEEVKAINYEEGFNAILENISSLLQR
jgi:hypothetical protein